MLRRYLLRVGCQATVINAYLSALMLLAGLAAAVFATAAVLRLRADEGGIALAAGAAGLISLRRRDLGDLGTAGLPGLAGPVRDWLADRFFPPAETP